MLFVPKSISVNQRLNIILGRHGIDCDEVFPGIVLGNGATVKKKEYLKSIGVSHVLNAAEFRGVNVGEDYFGTGFQYKGLRVEDTPQTQICR